MGIVVVCVYMLVLLLVTRVQKVQDLKQQNGCIYQINGGSYIHMISETEDPEKAETLLHDMLRNYRGGDVKARPSDITFSNILALWHKSTHPDAADRSMALFNEVKKLSIEWNRVSYCSLLSILDKHRRWDDFEAVYQDMISSYKAGNKFLKPSMNTLKLVLKAKSEMGCPEDANLAFSDIISEYNSGNLAYKPDGVCINLLLKAWLCSRRTDAAENAVVLFDSLKKEHKALYNSYTYGTVLSCIAGSISLDAWNNGLRIFEEMKAEKDVYLKLKDFFLILKIQMKLFANDNGNSESLHHIKRIISEDLVSLPQAMWQEQGEEFCTSMSNILRQYNVPSSELLITVLHDMNRQRSSSEALIRKQ